MLKIENRKIGSGYKPFIIAEMSGNHDKSLEKALDIVESAAECGADAIKLQTYKPETITLNIETDDFLIKDEDNLWKGQSLFKLYEQAFTPWEWHSPIINRAKELGLICFSSPFDDTAVEFLEDLNVPAYKIASFESIHIPLLKKVASTRKPVIVSTGLSTVSEISEAVSTLKNAGCNDIILLKCTSNYPSSPKDSDILTIPHMRDLFNCDIGLSDHTMGIGASIAAVAHGAVMIEKHFTLNRQERSVDSEFSLNPSELKSLVIESKIAWESLGTIKYGPNESEINSLKFRRSIYVSEDIKKGEEFSKKNIKVIRPAMGLHPRYFESIIGRKSKSDYKKGTPINLDMIL